MGTRFSVAAVLAFALSGCGGTGGGTSTISGAGPSFRDEDSTGGTPIKISYVRFNEEQDPVARTTKFVHHYRVMLSQGWMNRKGPKANEPFERIWREVYRGESVPDRVMEEIVKKAMAAGFGELRETPVDRINTEQLRRIEKMNDRATGQRTRFITIETEGFKKTAAYYDNDDSRAGVKGPLTAKFLAVEAELLQIMPMYTIMASVKSDSSMPRERK